MAGLPKPLGVVIVKRRRKQRVASQRLSCLLKEAALALGVSGEVALVLTGDTAIRALNARYRGKDRPTDVLSFPGPGAPRRDRGGRKGRPRDVWACDEGADGNLGDIIVSMDTAAQNARAQRRTLSQELDVLALHGFLHLLGYDHESDNGEMERLEGRLRRRLLGQRRKKP